MDTDGYIRWLDSTGVYWQKGQRIVCLWGASSTTKLYLHGI